MRWIRNPWWDGFWVLSGLPIGLALLFIIPNTHHMSTAAAAMVIRNSGLMYIAMAFFCLVVVLETAHATAPIVLAWTHSELRPLILARPRKHIWLPLVLIAICMAIGTATSFGWTSWKPADKLNLTDFANPFPALFWAYMAWNYYHFSMQNFGVVQLYRRRGTYRSLIKGCCILATAAAIVLPLIWYEFWLVWLAFGLLSMNHWLTAIGLCSAVSKRPWLFIGGVLLIGLLGFAWLIVTPVGTRARPVPLIAAIPMALGMIHFIYDSSLWRISDPQIRGIVSKSL